MEVDDNPQTQIYVRKFLNSVDMKSVLENVRQHIGVPDLSIETLRIIYTICAFETAWKRRRPKQHGTMNEETGQPASVWCQLLNNETLLAMEYIEDLEYYWKDGHGHDLTKQITCPALTDMFQHIT